MRLFPRLARCCVFPILFLVANYAAATELPATVRSALKHAGIPLAAVGIEVQQVGATSSMLAVNGDDAFSPA